MKNRLQTLLIQLNHELVEREAAVKTALLTVLAGENLLLLGPPGTGKSMIARRIAQVLQAGKGEHGYFEYLLTKFSTPEELFGPLSITALKADRYQRHTDGFLPSVKMAFLDEVFKASSSILNALLTILNERKYHNGAVAENVRLQALVAASNELPSGQDELGALYDRFLVRQFVDYVSQGALPQLLAAPTEAPAVQPLTDKELQQIRAAAAAVVLPSPIIEAVQRIWQQHKNTFKDDPRESLSDRRLTKVVGLLRVAAATNGRSEVDLSDLMLLKHCLWNHPDNAAKVRDLIMAALLGGSAAVKRAPVGVAGRGSAGAVKGYAGSGTEHDPLLIGSLQDLDGLQRQEVGQQGYYFRQTADLDCSKLSVRMNIRFKGHYDGGGHTIKHKRQDGDFPSLFNRLHGKSSVTGLKLDNLALAQDAEDSIITYCSASMELILGKASQCQISYCNAGSTLVLGEAAKTTINDCVVRFAPQWKDDIQRDVIGIATSAVQNTVVERCFVSGTLRNPGGGSVCFRGLVGSDGACSVRASALGKLDMKQRTSFMFPIMFDGIASRIAFPDKGVRLKNNISIDSNPGNDEADGSGGKTVDAAFFNKHYFEHNLDWDFDTVWQWDMASGQPQLRPQSAAPARAPASTADTTDLLTQQINANLWL